MCWKKTMEPSPGVVPRLLPKNNSPLDICRGSCIMVYIDWKGNNMSTFSIVNELNLADKRALIVELKDAIRVDMMAARVAKAKAKEIKKIARENRAYDRAAKKAARIAKLEAKLSALKNPVGAKAIKANKKPSNVTVLKAA